MLEKSRKHVKIEQDEVHLVSFFHVSSLILTKFGRA